MKKHIVLVGVLVLLLLINLGYLSAWEWDNVKSYDETTKEVTIVNALGLGDDIAKVKLDTPLNYYVPRGYQKVAQFTIENYGDYEEVFKLIELYDMKKEMDTIEDRQIDYKYLGLVTSEVKEYKIICEENTKVGNQTCTDVFVGMKNETKEGWIDLDTKTILPKGNITIGLFTEVKKGDIVEWIPTLYGIKIEEWAVWTESLNTGLIAYYKFDEESGTIIDSLHLNNLTNDGADNTTGKIIYGYDFERDNTDYMYAGGALSSQPTAEFSIFMWIKAESWPTWTQPAARMNTATGAATFQLGFYSPDGSPYFGVNDGAAATGRYVDNNTALSTGEWHFVGMTYKANDYITAYVDGVNAGTIASGAFMNWSSTNVLDIGRRNYDSGDYFDGLIDEVGIWNRTLTAEEVSGLYNSGDGISYSLDSKTITLNSPEEYYNSTSQSITFNCSCTAETGCLSLNLTVNSTVYETVTGAGNTNLSLQSTEDLGAEGYFVWYCTGNDGLGAKNSSIRNLTIDSSPKINITPPPYNTSNYTTSSVDVEAVSTLSVSYWIINYNGTNITVTGQEGTSLLEEITPEDGNFRLLVYGNNSLTGVWGLNDTIYFNVDSTLPLIYVTGGNGSLAYHNISANHTINYTITDTNLDSCWIDYNDTNITIPCTSGESNSTNFTIQQGIYNATIYSNDTLGNLNSRFLEWNYRLLLFNETYTSPIYEGTASTFRADFLTNGTDITIARLNYNGTDSYGTITENADNNFTVTLTRSSPLVTADTNISFYWNISSADTGYYALPSNNQTVKNLLIDNCTINENVLYNFTIVDEETQVELNETALNSLAEINLQLYIYGTSTVLQEFNSIYNITNPFAVCFNNTFVSEQYNLNLQVRYGADGYAQEIYHIQNETITVDDFTTNITLYDVNASDAQSFKLTYKDSSNLPVENALIVIGRKYIGEGVFKDVEIPKTDSKGQTVANLVVNNVIYNFTIIKNGVILDTFNNVLAVCQTPLVSECAIEFNSLGTGVDIPNFDNEEDFNYTLTYNETSKVVSSTFAIPSNTPSKITLEVIKEDALGTSVCTDELTSSTGTLSCTIPNTIGNSTVRAVLYKDDYYVSYGTIKLDQNATDIYGTVLVFLGVFVIMTLIGIGLSGNPVITLSFVFVGFLCLIALNLIEGSWLGKGAIMLYFVIIVVIMLIKAGGRT